MKKIELTPHNGRKSFYGKAVVLISDEGHKYLDNYNTRVATYTNLGLLQWINMNLKAQLIGRATTGTNF